VSIDRIQAGERKMWCHGRENRRKIGSPTKKQKTILGSFGLFKHRYNSNADTKQATESASPHKTATHPRIHTSFTSFNRYEVLLYSCKYGVRFVISFTRKLCPTKSDTFHRGWSVLFFFRKKAVAFWLFEMEDARNIWRLCR
jgi:hypothetical protein